jgi:hypothetical protein
VETSLKFTLNLAAKLYLQERIYDLIGADYMDSKHNNSNDLENIEDDDISFSFFDMDGPIALNIGSDNLVIDADKIAEPTSNNHISRVVKDDKVGNVKRKSKVKDLLAMVKPKRVDKQATEELQNNNLHPHLDICEDDKTDDGVSSSNEEVIKIQDKIEMLKSINITSSVNIDIEGLKSAIDNLVIIPEMPIILDEVSDSRIDVGDLIKYEDKKEEKPAEIIQIQSSSLGKSDSIAKWLTEAFITKPIAALFKMLYTAFFSIFQFIGV